MSVLPIFALCLALLLSYASATNYTLLAGATSVNGQWDFTHVYPNGLTPAFTIQAGDSITFLLGGANKTITFSDRPFIPLIDLNGGFDSALQPTGPSPITVSDTNATYSSGLLSAGASFTFFFPVPGVFPFLDVILGSISSSITVTDNTVPAPYTPSQIATFAGDQLAYTNTLLQGYFVTASALSSATKVLLGWVSTDGTGVSYTLPIGPNPVAVVTPGTVTFLNADNRRHAVFISSTNTLPTNMSLWLVPSAASTIDGVADVSSGVLYPNGAYTVTFTAAGTYTWYDFLAATSGNVTVTLPPATPSPKSAGDYVGAFFLVLAVVLLIIVIGTIILVSCDYCCVARRKIQKGLSDSLEHLSPLKSKEKEKEKDKEISA